MGFFRDMTSDSAAVSWTRVRGIWLMVLGTTVIVVGVIWWIIDRRPLTDITALALGILGLEIAGKGVQAISSSFGNNNNGQNSGTDSAG